jgi:hypothetical protein
MKWVLGALSIGAKRPIYEGDHSLPLNAELKNSFIHQWLYSPFLSPGLFFSFVIFFTQSVGLLGRMISPSQGRYLHTGQHEHRINAHTDIHALGGTRTYDPSVRASEGSSCLRPRGYCHQFEIKNGETMYLHFSIHLHILVLNYFSKGKTLNFIVP